jgi:anti-sigma-K factor RskA
MTDHHWTELAAAYPLGALAPGERADFEVHLAECAACRAEVQAFREVTGLLAYDAPAATPAPALRDRVLRESRRVRSIDRRSATPWPWLVAAAALVLALVLGYSNWSSRADRSALRSELESTRSRLDSTSARLDSTRARLDSTNQLVATVLDSTVATADLVATGKAPSIRLFWNRTRNVVIAAAFDLPPAPAGRSYQLWAIRKGQPPVSLGTFNPPPSGRATVTVRMPAGFQPDLSAVTEEPAGGSPQPTQQPFLVGPWQGGR